MQISGTSVKGKQKWFFVKTRIFFSVGGLETWNQPCKIIWLLCWKLGSMVNNPRISFYSELLIKRVQGGHLNLGGGFKDLLEFYSKIGEYEPILTSIFFRWVVQPPTRLANKHDELKAWHCCLWSMMLGLNVIGIFPIRTLQNSSGAKCATSVFDHMEQKRETPNLMDFTSPPWAWTRDNDTREVSTLSHSFGQVHTSSNRTIRLGDQGPPWWCSWWTKNGN